MSVSSALGRMAAMQAAKQASGSKKGKWRPRKMLGKAKKVVPKKGKPSFRRRLRAMAMKKDLSSSQGTARKGSMRGQKRRMPRNKSSIMNEKEA